MTADEVLFSFGGEHLIREAEWKDFPMRHFPPRPACVYRIGSCIVCGGPARYVIEPKAEVECLGLCNMEKQLATG